MTGGLDVAWWDLADCGWDRGGRYGVGHGGGTIMLMTIAVLLIILWLLGMISAYTLGGFIHILLVVAIIVLLVRVIQGRRVV